MRRTYYNLGDFIYVGKEKLLHLRDATNPREVKERLIKMYRAFWDTIFILTSKYICLKEYVLFLSCPIRYSKHIKCMPEKGVHLYAF